LAKVAMVGTPCQILAASIMDDYSDYPDDMSVDLKTRIILYGKVFAYSYLKELFKKVRNRL